MRMKHMAGAALFLALTLGAGCDFNSERGRVILEISYPSGYVRDCYTWEDTAPVEGAQYRLETERAENFKETRRYDIRILTQDGQMIYQYPGAGFSVVRGELEETEAGGDHEKVWIVSENWDTPHYSGYISGGLKESILLEIDMKTGEIRTQRNLGENELFLTSVKGRCYFYSCGQKGQEKLGGLWKVPGSKARIYCRDQEDWEEERVYEFDYELEPEFEEHVLQGRLRFSFEGAGLVVSRDSEVSADREEKSGESEAYPKIRVPFGAEQEEHEGQGIDAGGGNTASGDRSGGYVFAGMSDLSERGPGRPGVLYLKGAGADF